MTFLAHQLFLTITYADDNIHERVQMGITKSILQNIKTGVQQGLILGHLLFII